MIELELFFAFLKIGLFSFGGGYGMISLIRETVIGHGWMKESQLLDFIAVSESTPGPIAVNMATFIGASQAGIWGSLAATCGVILPSFLIILLITACITGFLKYRAVNAFLAGVRPAVVAMILSTAIVMGLSVLFSFPGDAKKVDGKGIFLLLLLFCIHIGMKKFFGKRPSPIVLLIFSAVMGILLYR